MCTSCWQLNLDDHPLCRKCAADLESGGRDTSGLLGVTMVLGFGSAFWLQRHAPVALITAYLLAFGCCLVALFFWARRERARALQERLRIRRRRPDELTPLRSHPSPSGTFGRRLVRAVGHPAEDLSGKAVTVVALGCMVVTATAVPVALHLPRWLEAEAVIGTWWGMMWAFLAYLLFRGRRILDDRRPPPSATPRLVTETKETEDSSSEGGTRSTWLGELGSTSFEALEVGGAESAGCGEAIGGVVIALAVLGAAWALVEFVFPALFLLVYSLTVQAVARVTRDGHDCHGRASRALLWGGVWACAYAAPLLLVVWGVHRLLMVTPPNP